MSDDLSTELVSGSELRGILKTHVRALVTMFLRLEAFPHINSFRVITFIDIPQRTIRSSQQIRYRHEFHRVFNVSFSSCFPSS
jgi:hypothetical protein